MTQAVDAAHLRNVSIHTVNGSYIACCEQGETDCPCTCHDAPSADEQLRTQTRAAVQQAPVSQAEIARQLGLSTKHLNQMLTGRAPLSLVWAEGILGLCGMDLVITVRPSEEQP
ncbi:hypothetical protein [Streptomyces spinosirectus]